MERYLDYFEPEKYVLDLKVDKSKKTIGGRVSVVGKAIQNKIKFHAVNMDVTEVLIHGKPAKFSLDNDVLEIELGESAMVMGQGLLGIFATQFLRLSGANPVIAVDLNPQRRELALKLGADYAFDPSDKDFVEKVKEIVARLRDMSPLYEDFMKKQK